MVACFAILSSTVCHTRHANELDILIYLHHRANDGCSGARLREECEAKLCFGFSRVNMCVFGEYSRIYISLGLWVLDLFASKWCRTERRARS